MPLGMNQSRHIWEIDPGYYSMRFGKKCPRVPVLLERVEDELVITVNGVEQGERYSADPDAVADLIAGTMIEGTANLHPLVKFHWGEKITKREYDHLLSVVAYWQKRNPDHPILHPMRPVDLSKVESLW